jgi:hypothetical protein
MKIKNSKNIIEFEYPSNSTTPDNIPEIKKFKGHLLRFSEFTDYVFIIHKPMMTLLRELYSGWEITELKTGMRAYASDDYEENYEIRVTKKIATGQCLQKLLKYKDKFPAILKRGADKLTSPNLYPINELIN